MKASFFYGGTKQIILLLISFLLLAIGFLVVGIYGLNATTVVWGVFATLLGAMGIMYYSGYYHKWLRPSLESEIY